MTTPPPRPNKARLAVVIGSGGLKCAAAMGLWKVLQREGIPIDMVVGCSGGSMYAAVIALGLDYEAVARINAAGWANSFSQLYIPSLLRAALPQVFGFNERFGLVNDRQINTVFARLFGDRTFAEAQLPLHIVACDFHSREKVVLSQGRIRDAVRASIAIPVLLRPWKIEGRLLIDGGAVDPLPVDVAIREGCDIILAMGFETPNTPHLNSLPGIIGQTTGILTNSLLQATYSFYSMAHHAEIIPILPTFDRPISLGEAHLIPYIEERGEQAAEAQLGYLRRLLASMNDGPDAH